MTEGDRLLAQAEAAEEQGHLEEAFQLLLTGALLGDPSCQTNLGNAYADGRGTPTDTAAARHWYLQAYQQGYLTGAFNLGIDYRNAGDYKNATHWLRQAANGNDGDACVDLAELMLDREERRVLLQKALSLPNASISEEGRERAAILLADLT